MKYAPENTINRNLALPKKKTKENDVSRQIMMPQEKSQVDFGNRNKRILKNKKFPKSISDLSVSFVMLENGKICFKNSTV